MKLRRPMSQKIRYLTSNRTLTTQFPQFPSLSDLQPADWAFQALKSLNQRYGGIAGYPDNTYLGNRVLSRYELVAGSNGCLNTINQQLGMLLELSL
jgi:hypothetical protein